MTLTYQEISRNVAIDGGNRQVIGEFSIEVDNIEEQTLQSMLSLLAFKRSMFAGVLDGATDEVFMGDSALNRFMKTVEAASSSVPKVEKTPEERGNGRIGEEAHPPEGRVPKTPSAQDAPVARAAAAALGELLTKGAEALQTLGQALAAPSSGSNGKRRAPAGPRIETETCYGSES